MSEPRILIACIGNIFLGDDGFGVEVARRMAARPLPPGVILKDYGIRSFDLTYALMESYDLVVFVDACARGGKPGEVYLIEPDPVEQPETAVPMEPHGMKPMNVLRLVKSMGGASNRIVIVGCEPADLGSDEEGKLGLTEPVEAAVDKAIELIDRIVLERVQSRPMEAVAR